MTDVTILIPLPVYLAQWYAWEQHSLSGDSCEGYRYDAQCQASEREIIRTRRFSVERAVLAEHLRRQPVCRERDGHGPGGDGGSRSVSNSTAAAPALRPAIRLALPWTDGKSPVYYNHLDRRGERAVEDVIRMRFRKDLYLWMERHYDHGRKGVQLQEAVAEYMRTHGISDTDANYESVKQQYRRQRDVYRKLRVNS